MLGSAPQNQHDDAVEGQGGKLPGKGAKTRLKQVLGLAKDAWSSWSEDYAPSMGAALSYYTMFSIAPLLVIVISVAGLVFGQDAVQGQIVGQLSGLIGEQSAETIQGMLQSVSAPKQGVLATVVGVVVLLVGATTVFGELQTALDRIWRVPAPAKVSGVLKLLRTRLLSLGMILGLGFLSMVSLVVGAAFAALGSWYGGLFAGFEAVLHVVNFLLPLGFTTVLFAMIYKLMPRAKIAWRDVWVGAGVTALLFNVGKLVIGLYLGKSSVTSGFGAAGSLVVLLVWVYYSAQIFLLGAEFTWAYAKRYGSMVGQVDEKGGRLAVPSKSQTDAVLDGAAPGKARSKEPKPKLGLNAGGHTVVLSR
jgi:membrane protein